MRTDRYVLLLAGILLVATLVFFGSTARATCVCPPSSPSPPSGGGGHTPPPPPNIYVLGGVPQGAPPQANIPGANKGGRNGGEGHHGQTQTGNQRRWDAFQRMQQGRREFAEAQGGWSDYCGRWETGATIVKWTASGTSFVIGGVVGGSVAVAGFVGRGLTFVSGVISSRLNSPGSGSDSSVGRGSTSSAGSIRNQMRQGSMGWDTRPSGIETYK